VDGVLGQVDVQDTEQGLVPEQQPDDPDEDDAGTGDRGVDAGERLIALRR
jgi:hypothetical protein